MNRLLTLRGRTASTLAILLALAAVASCGGGGDGVVGSGGTGSPLGVAVGTVNGFGSVIVDGVAYDNRGATVVSEAAPGQDVIAEVKLGDRVAVEYETAGVAKVVRVEAALAGPVSAIVAADQFTMLGQTVSVNASGAAGPITQFGGGYSQASDVRAGDSIEVHGLLVRQAATYRIQATRVERLAAAPAYLRVTGLVGELSKAGAVPTFRLGALTVDMTGASVVPAGAALANDQSVTVLALPASLAIPGPGQWRLQAAQVRVRELVGGGLGDSVSGSVSHLDAGTKTFSLGSLRVHYASAVMTPAGATLAEERYVLVQGTIGADGSLTAASVTVRDTGSESEAELHGNITNYDAASGRFSVRDVLVDASLATLEACPATGLANGLYVEIEGSLGSTGVIASKVHCEGEPAGATIEREGVASAVDTTALTFTLTPEEGAPVPVKWTSSTYFGFLTPGTLAGQKVEVEGSLTGGVLVATKVKLED